MPEYYDLVPKDRVENLEWRIKCRKQALADPRFRNAFWQACMDDVCYFMAAVCWGYDPRSKHKIVPFVPWPHQEEVFRKLDWAIDYCAEEERTLDVLVDKSRAQGGTFGYLWVDLRRWLRDPMFSAGYVTRNADLVDSKTDSDTVLWKMQFALDMLPEWMVPKYARNLTQHTFENRENGALLKGYAAGQDVAAGGRATVFTMDEAGAKDFVAAGKDYAVMEALHDVSNCAAEGTLVVTDSGLIPIEDVGLFHRVWDGSMWVGHEGCVHQGEQKVISAYGIECTPDHEILTTEGWKHASAKGFDREEVRLPDGYRERFIEAEEGVLGLPVQVWDCEDDYGAKLENWPNKKLRMLRQGCEGGEIDDAWDVQHANPQFLGRDDPAMHQPEKPALRKLWRPWNQSVRTLEKVREFLCRHGGATEGAYTGSHRQFERLFSEKLSMGQSQGAAKQYANKSYCRNIARLNDAFRGGEGGWDICFGDEIQAKQRLADGENTRSTEVYDLLNCGPNQRFTVIGSDGRPLIIHNCLRLVSARYLDSGVFHEACEASAHGDPEEGGLHLILDWKDHPVHGRNSYVVNKEGIPVARKPEEADAVAAYHAEKPNLRDLLERKGYKYDGVVRSPWYDMRCLRKTARPQLIASQLDRNPRGAVGKVFSSELLERMKNEHSKPPIWRGVPVFDEETLKLTGLLPREDGPLTLYFKPGIDSSPPIGPFTVGCDISSGGVGAYSSNSVASIIDDRTGEQVGEYVIKGMEPRPFARRVIGLCLWLRNALLGWEDSGVSGGFAKEVMEVWYYGNVFFRDVTQLGSQKKSKKPGWPCRDADKADMFELFALAMENQDYVPRSKEMLQECGEYEWDGAKIIHAPTKNKGATEKNHGDRAIAAAGTWMIYSGENANSKVDSSEEIGQTMQYGSFLWREMQEKRSVNSGSPEFGVTDLMFEDWR
jgi:hypothetical protein